MAILPDHQFNGIGGELIRQGLIKAKEMGFESVIVLGHADYYPRFGFVEAAAYNIKCPWDVPNNVFMLLELNKGALKQVHGLVDYAQAFMEL